MSYNHHDSHYGYNVPPDEEDNYNQQQYTDPFHSNAQYQNSRSTDRLQQLEPSYAGESYSAQRRRSSEMAAYDNYDSYNTYEHQTQLPSSSFGTHYQDNVDSRYYNNPVVEEAQEGAYTRQYSPIEGSMQPQIPSISVYSSSPQRYQENDIYRNDQALTGSSFNGFPFDPSDIDSRPPLPPVDTYYYGAEGSRDSYSNVPLQNGPFDHSVDKFEEYDPAVEEMNIGQNISGDNYELNTFAPETTEEYQFAEEGEHGEIPDETQRRKIEVGLLNGNLILDCPVPDRILEKYITKNIDDSREFKFMRYQAATCDPSRFVGDNFSLRQRYYKRPREIEILIVVTIYNESDVLLARTLKGIFDNIKHLEGRNRSNTWGPDSWKKVVVCIVADGRSKINETAQALLAGLGVYQEGFARSAVNEKKVVSHIYEYTSWIGISSIDKDKVKLQTNKVPVQLLFCLKEENQKKINSHRWALQAFGEVLQPKVVVLLDAGTQPSKDSIYHLWKEFDKDPNVAGTCGEIKAMLGNHYQKLLNPLVAAQNFEYKMSNILDKPMESSFGFISVLPGAFSAYRYTALQNHPNGEGPLARYFEGETLHDANSGIFKANMYLAEDRILCFELVAKRNCSWVLRYCRSASAETDVPEEVHDFVSQRRRWLNGSFFAAIYSMVHFHKLMSSSHSFGRKLALIVEFFYQFLALLVSWFSLGSYFLVFRILTTSLGDLYTPCRYLSVVFLWLYLLSLVTTFILSFGNTPRGTPRFYLVIMIFFAVLMAYMMAAAIIMSVDAIRQVFNSGQTVTASTVFQNRTFRDLIISTLSTYALYFIASFIHLKPMHMLTSFMQYLLLSPSYVNVLNIYAFCNLHDISWGTKGATATVLGKAKVTQDGKVEFVDAPITNDEINDLYEKQMAILAHIPVAKPQDTPESLQIEAERRSEKAEEKKKDYYAFIRSMVVLVWITTNFVIIALVLETGGVNQLANDTSNTSATTNGILDRGRSQIFLTVILWIVAFMAAFRLLGTVYYLISRMVK